MNAKPFIQNQKTFAYYHPFEHAYLSDYLGLERPEYAKELNPHNQHKLRELLAQVRETKFNFTDFAKNQLIFLVTGLSAEVSVIR